MPHDLQSMANRITNQIRLARFLIRIAPLPIAVCSLICALIDTFGEPLP